MRPFGCCVPREPAERAVSGSEPGHVRGAVLVVAPALPPSPRVGDRARVADEVDDDGPHVGHEPEHDGVPRPLGSIDDDARPRLLRDRPVEP